MYDAEKRPHVGQKGRHWRIAISEPDFRGRCDPIEISSLVRELLLDRYWVPDRPIREIPNP